MAAHKAPTAVTIAPVQEKSLLARGVERYWKAATILALAVAGSILYFQHRRSSARAEDDQSWDRLLSVAQEDRFSRILSGEPAEFLGAAEQVKGKHAGAWALYLAATSAAASEDYEGARSALARLRQEYPTHSLLTEGYSIPGVEGTHALVEHLEARIGAQGAWKAANPSLFANPPPPADAPRVRIHTDKGEILVALYATEAPKHCDNFLKLAREGYYNGVKFHRVVPGFMIQAGDPNSIQGDPATWGQGGPDYKIPREENSLKHFSGVLAAAKKGADPESSGSQFYITAASTHHLDGKYVVFGQVLEGMSVAHAIERLPLAQGTGDRPETPAIIQSMDVAGP